MKSVTEWLLGLSALACGICILIVLGFAVFIGGEGWDDDAHKGE